MANALKKKLAGKSSESTVIDLLSDDSLVVADGREDAETAALEEVKNLVTRTMPEDPFSVGLVHESFMNVVAAPWLKTEEHMLLLCAMDNAALATNVSFGTITVKSSFVTRKGGSFFI